MSSKSSLARIEGVELQQPESRLAPHPLLQGYYHDEAERQAYLKSAFQETAPLYDRINSWMSFGTDRRYRRDALVRAGLRPGMEVADIGCGTGLVSELAREIVGAEGRVVSVDPSEGMMGEAVRRGRATVPVIGRGEALPLPDASADFLCMGFALRHVADLKITFLEYARVLRPGGRLLLMEMTPPQQGLLHCILKGYMRYVVPALTRIATGSSTATVLYAYCWDTFEHCVRPASVLDALRDAGLEQPSRHVEARIFSEYTATKPA
jgi:demethylmenaquinone methyltransferase/2-methoxy-6-polyprenyl-1,4-benzoquinol methylase